MDPLSVLASAITTYVLPKALEKVGEKIGEASLAKSGETIQAMRKTVQDKLKETHTEGVLAIASENPSQVNVDVLETILLNQMQADSDFVNQLEMLLQRAHSQSPSLQVILDEVRIKGNVTIGNVKQSNTAGTAQQVIGRNLGVGGDLKIGNISQNS